MGAPDFMYQVQDQGVRGTKKGSPMIGEPSVYMFIDLLEICEILLNICCRSNENLLEFLLTGTCRDRMSADDILL